MYVPLRFICILTPRVRESRWDRRNVAGKACNGSRGTILTNHARVQSTHGPISRCGRQERTLPIAHARRAYVTTLTVRYEGVVNRRGRSVAQFVVRS